MRATMSHLLQTAVRGPSFICLGKRPDLIPAYQVDFETGIGPLGASMSLSRTSPTLLLSSTLIETCPLSVLCASIIL